MPDLKGSLAVFQPIPVLQMLNLAEATGELKLVRPGNSASVYFEKGSITFAGIKEHPVKLGEYLVQHGLVDRQVVDDALATRGSRRKRLGELLMEAGHIDEAGLKNAIIEQIKSVIYEIVRWQAGSFAFYKDRKPSPQEIRIDIPLDHLMLEGLKLMDEEREDRR